MNFITDELASQFFRITNIIFIMHTNIVYKYHNKHNWSQDIVLAGQIKRRAMSGHVLRAHG